jgi:putative flippase GtrA
MNDAENTPPSAAETVRPISLLERIPVGLRQFAKFAVVGGTGTLVNLAVFQLLVFIYERATGSSAGIFNQVAVGIAFCVAVTSNFLLNRFWTFRNRGRIVRNFSRFFLVSLVGLGLNELLFTLLHNVAGVHRLFSLLLAILIVTPFNFVGSKWWAFR